MSYPKRLGDFRKWAKAMEEGAVMDRPEYPSKYPSGLTQSGRKKSTRRKRRTHPRRMRRKKKED